MQIDIDFELFKALTALRRHEEDSLSDVIRRLIKKSQSESSAVGKNALSGPLAVGAQNALAARTNSAPQNVNALAAALGGAWFDNLHFPEGTQFLARYKGNSYQAEIKNGVWLGEDGIERSSPSAAASAICDSNVNGWRFWFAKRPTDAEWQKMDDLRQ